MLTYQQIYSSRLPTWRKPVEGHADSKQEHTNKTSLNPSYELLYSMNDILTSLPNKKNLEHAYELEPNSPCQRHLSFSDSLDSQSVVGVRGVSSPA